MKVKLKGKRRKNEAAKRKPSVAVVGAGRLGCFLAVALREAGFAVREIVGRDGPDSRRRARLLAAKVGARAVTAESAALDATIIWLCVPDSEIRGVASVLADRLLAQTSFRRKAVRNFAFHSSGALGSRELAPLRTAGLALASVHPLMTFVRGAHPSLAGVPFAIEGDDGATREARQLIRQLGGEIFALPAGRKAAYHAWATMTSPLLLAFLVTLEEAAGEAGLTRQGARRKGLPIIRQTVANYARLGAAASFSGPLVRGDAETMAKHLAVLKKSPGARDVYVALARAALRGLPVKNRQGLERLLRAAGAED